MNIPDDSTPGRGAELRPTTNVPHNWSPAVEATRLRLDLKRARTDAEAGRSKAAESAVDTLLASIDRLRRSRPLGREETDDLSVIEASALSLRAQLLDSSGRSTADQAGLLERALGVFTLVTGSRDVAPHTWADYGAVLDILGRTTDAERALRRAVEQGDASRQARHRLARIMLSSGRPEEAESILREILGADGKGDDPTTMRLLGDSLWARGDPRAYEAYLAAASTLLAAGRLDQAVEVATLATEAGPARVDAQLVLVDALRLLGDNTSALGVIDDVLLLAPDDPRALGAKADILRTNGEYDRAVEALDAILAQFPDDAFALGMKADALRARGNLDEALPLLDRAVERGPADAWNLGTRGQVLRALGRQADARADLLRALKLSKDMPWVMAELAALEFEAGDYVAAREQAAAALNREPTHPVALAIMGYVYQQSGDFPAAESTFEDLVRLAPEWPDAWRGLAAVQDVLGRPAEALQSVQRALELDPADEETVKFGVDLLLQNGKNDAVLELVDAFRKREDPPAWAMVARAAALRQAGELDAALAELRGGLEAHSGIPSLHGELARTLEAQGSGEDALEAYSTALQLDGGAIALRRELADLEFRLGRYNEAARTLEVADGEPAGVGTADDLIRRGEALRLAGRAREARDCLLRALDLDAREVRALDLDAREVRAREVRALTGLLYVYLDLGKPARARIYAVRVLESGGKRDPALLADVALVDAAEKKFDAALDRTARAMDLALHAGSEDGWVRFVRGQTLNRVGQWAEAAEVLRPLRDSNPSAATLSEFGWALENAVLLDIAERIPDEPPRLDGSARTRLREAQEAYDGALRQEPKGAWHRRGLADVLRLQGDDLLARKHFDAIIRQLSSTSVYGAGDLGLLAWCHYSLGNPSAAVPLYINAVSTDTADTEYLHFDLGLALLASNQPDLAESSYRRGLGALRGSERHLSLATALVARNDLAAAQFLEQIHYEVSRPAFRHLNDRIRELSARAFHQRPSYDDE
jgi:tetratricopeptide (TPR) repeat protein